MASLVFASVMSYITYSDCSSTVYELASEERPAMPQMALASQKIKEFGSSFMQSVARVQQSHLLSLMLDGNRSEALEALPSGQAEPKQLPWLLSTQT